MSYAWGFLKKDRESIFLNSIFWGIVTTLLIGVPILLMSKNYMEKIPIWIGIIFAIIVFPISTFSFYKAGCKRPKKDK